MILINLWQENNVQKAGSEGIVSKIVSKCTNDEENEKV